MNKLRKGYTTGTCAACAASAAVKVLLGDTNVCSGEVTLPDGEHVELTTAFIERNDDSAEAAVRKTAGDDPDDTDGALVKAMVVWRDKPGVGFVAGSGVGIVTKPGLSIPVGEAAINPTPRRMIFDAINKLTRRGVTVTISIPDGEEIAKKTFNPRLGIVGGLSILGSSGRVVPYSCPAIQESLRLALRVAAAQGVAFPVLAPGNIGARAARQHFLFDEDALIPVSNEWGTMLEEARRLDFRSLLAVGHPGKLAKLIDGHFQTHSGQSPSALPIVQRIAAELSIVHGEDMPTVEGYFTTLECRQRTALAIHAATLIQRAIATKLQGIIPAVALIDMNSDLLGAAGDLSPWSKTV
jgi:cobalt-precorrin-5B (C1)-methyltransferase